MNGADLSVTYRSTRGEERSKSFEEVVFNGLASDRGLYVPERIPSISKEEIESWRSFSYVDLAHAVLRSYIRDDQIPSQDLRFLLEKSFKSFRSPDVTPIVKIENTWVLELFHGPTFAFKDVALQFLGNLFEYFLERRRKNGEKKELNILGATSGDTGSAAIYGMRGKKYMQCFILFPEGRVSEIQERQMTTVADENIHCISIDGSFDDCQSIVKGAFADKIFREETSLGAVNSINWARVLAQTTYYFWAYFRITDKQGMKNPVNFSVPTGNFGDILAGYYCREMGLNIAQLIVATNENDILHRFFTSGKYWKEKPVATISPSMDICISSNFERYLFHLADNNKDILNGWFAEFEKSGKLTVEGELLKKAKKDFLSARVDQKQNLENIKHYFDSSKYLFCPHSSIGMVAAKLCHVENPNTAVLATAHPSKFPAAIGMVIPIVPPAPQELQIINSLPTRKASLQNSLSAVQSHMLKSLKKNEQAPNKTRQMEPTYCTSGKYYFAAGLAACLAATSIILLRRNSKQ